MNTKTTTKTLTDCEGGTLHVYTWASGRVYLVARDDDRRVEFGPVERHVLLDAIHGVAGETGCDAVSPGDGYQCTRERGHITEHVAMTMDGEVRDTWPVETDDKPEPVPSKSPTAEDFARAEFARNKDGRIAARMDDDDQPWCVQSPMTYYTLRSDAYMAAEGWSIVTPAPTTPREALALLVDLAYEPEGDTMPDQPGYMRVGESGVINICPDSNPRGLPVRGIGYRRLLLDPPVTPAWHDARIVEATCRGRVCQWARTATDGLWVSLDGASREAYTPDLTDVSIVVPTETDR